MHLRKSIAVSLIPILIALFIATSSYAASIVPTTGTQTAVADNYTGWTYITTTDGAAQANVWKWTGDAANPWAADKLDAGASAYVYPWGSGWNWAWRGGTWYAVHTPQVSVWSCTSFTGSPAVFAKTFRASVPIVKYNSSTAANAGTFEVYDDLTLSCANGYKDASGGTKIYALVKLTKRTYCATFAWDCILNPAAASTVSGYVDVSLISDVVNLPPPGTFGTIPS